MDFKIEVCVDNIYSILNAQSAGADRIELCSALSEGGLTPSYGMLKEVRAITKIPVFVMLRPRRGDFVYHDSEVKMMLHDIQMIKSLGFEGIVSGCLDREANIDTKLLKILIDHVKPLSFTFHRAFDLCKDPFTALEMLIDCGVDRVLTSGLQETALQGKDCIKQLIEQSDNRIIIIPGSGINEKNFFDFHSFVQAEEYHLSAGQIICTNVLTSGSEVNMGIKETLREHQLKITNSEIIKHIKKENK